MRSSDNPFEVVEWAPNICRNGHRLINRNVLVGWMPCVCQAPATGHRTYECRTCGATWYHPPHTNDNERVF